MKFSIPVVLAALAAFFVLAVGSTAAPQGTTVTFKDTWHRCSQPLTAYGELPVTFNVDISPGVVIDPPNGAGVIQLGQGCSGPGQDGVLDLTIIIPGDGLTYGAGHDAVRFMNASPCVRDMDVQILADCGPRQGGNHQDGLQILGGTNVTIWDSRIGGDYDAGKATCQGAGGVVFYSLPSTDVDVEGGKFIGCNHALNAHSGTGTQANVENASFRSGYEPGDAVCSAYFTSQACDLDSGWGGATENINCDRYPWDTDPSAPPPSPPPPSPPPPPPPPSPPPPPYNPA